MAGQANRYRACCKPFSLIGLHFYGPRLPLKRLLTTDRVAVPSQARTKDQALAELVRMAAPHSSVQSELLAGVLAREASVPTMLGDGVAMPHVRTPLVSSVLMSACVLEEPVEFGATEGYSVDVLFLLLLL